MVGFILKKTIFKKYEEELQNRLVKFLSKKFSTTWNSIIIFHLVVIFLPIILLGMSLKNINHNDAQNILLLVTCIGYELLMIVFYKVFRDEIFYFCGTLIPVKAYYLLYTQNGKALSKTDFNQVKKEYPKLYEYISTPLCQGMCYAISFELLKVLKKGSIKFVAVHKLGDENYKLQPYTMHVLYSQNGWVLDTYNQRQYTVEKSLSLHSGIVYTDFSYEDVKDLTYEEFREKHYEECANWCKEHNCEICWKTKTPDC